MFQSQRYGHVNVLINLSFDTSADTYCIYCIKQNKKFEPGHGMTYLTEQLVVVLQFFHYIRQLWFVVILNGNLVQDHQ